MIVVHSSAHLHWRWYGASIATVLSVTTSSRIVFVAIPSSAPYEHSSAVADVKGSVAPLCTLHCKATNRMGWMPKLHCTNKTVVVIFVVGPLTRHTHTREIGIRPGQTRILHYRHHFRCIGAWLMFMNDSIQNHAYIAACRSASQIMANNRGGIERTRKTMQTVITDPTNKMRQKQKKNK